MPLIDSSDADIEAFDTVCRRLGGFGGRVTTEWADGYLTALAAGPRSVPIAEWLPRLAADAFERAFADPEDEANARAVLAARARVLANQLDPEELLEQPEQLRLQPLVSIWDEAGREELVRDHGMATADAAQFITGVLWAEGFLDAVEDFANDWELPVDVPDEERELHDELLGDVSVLLLPEDSEDFKAHLEQRAGDQLLTREDLLDEACFAIQDLRVWWLDHAPRPATRRVEVLPGRNDPCPCGSGLKYKKCHGKAA